MVEPRPSRHWAAAAGLFLLAPLVAEYLLGNIAIDAWWALPIIAPLYGGGAVVVRETGRRLRGGWPSILLLAGAFAVFEEAFVTQSLFNPSYFGTNLLAWAHVAALGLGAWWSMYVVVLHVVWSIAVPIALVEAISGEPQTPWLGRTGLAAAGVMLMAGGVLNFTFTYRQEAFVASPAQLAGALLVLLMLLAASLARRAAPGAGRSSVERGHVAPSPRRAGSVAFGASSLFALGLYLPGWFTVAVWTLLVVAMAMVISRWSARQEWGDAHRLAMAGGALLTQAWQGFPHAPVMGSAGGVDLVGNAIFAIAAMALWRVARGRVEQR